MKELIKLFILFFIGGFSYYLIEILYRGYSHTSMLVVGGIAFVAIGYINVLFTWEMPLYKQCFIATIIVLILELTSGCVLNLLLGLNIWDYSELPFNLLGQIQLYFAIVWYFLSVIAILLDDYIRWVLFKENKPRYRLL